MEVWGVAAGVEIGEAVGVPTGCIEVIGEGPYPKYGLLLTGPGINVSSLVGE